MIHLTKITIYKLETRTGRLRTMLKTACGVKINKEGYLVTNSGDINQQQKPIELLYEHQTIYFCEQVCREDFLNALNKDEWMKNHK